MLKRDCFNYMLYFCLTVFLLISKAAVAKDILVPDEFSSIQAAIDAASSGDRVLVSAGRYEESITAKSNVEVRGVETARTFLLPSVTGPTITIADDEDFKLRNVTLIDNTNGIQIADSLNIEITNVVFDLGVNSLAIITIDGSTVDIINNTFVNNNIDVLAAVDFVTVRNNIFSDSRFLNFSASPNADFAYNCFSDANDVIGSDAVSGDILFVDTSAGDFHLQVDSVCIDIGTGQDVYDNSVADAGAYGGEYIDNKPFPVLGVELTDSTSNDLPPYSVRIDWESNESYQVVGYKIYYDSDQSGEPYEGQDVEDEFGQMRASPFNVGRVTRETLYNIPIPNATPAAPVLEQAIPANRQITLQWEKVSDANAYQIEYGVDSSSGNRIDVGDVDEYILEDLENDVRYSVVVRAISRAKYYVAVSAINASDGESELIEEENIIVGPQQISLASNELQAIPSLLEAYPNLPDQSDTRCFIATAAYGSPDAFEVKLLRSFRDRYLLTSKAGQKFVEQYYRHSPFVASIIKNNKALKVVVRLALMPLSIIAAALVATLKIKFILLAVLFGMLAISRFNVMNTR